MTRSKFGKRSARSHEYNENHRDVLLTGGNETFAKFQIPDFLPRGGEPTIDGIVGPLSRDAVEAAWQDLADELLPAYVASHPGQRPWAFWQFDVTEARRRIDAQYIESEPAFLDRHGLLSDTERQAVREQYHRNVRACGVDPATLGDYPLDARVLPARVIPLA